MSQENVEVARRFFEALSRRDYEAATPCLHPDAEWRNTSSLPGPQSLAGQEAIFEFCETLLESFAPDWAAPIDDSESGSGVTHIEELRASGACVVAVLHSRGRGKTSGVPVESRYAATALLRGGRIERIEISGDPAKALRAAGLEE